MDGERERATLLYDRDCRFCCWSLRRLLAWDRHDRIRPVALQEPVAERLLAAIDAQRRMDSWHLVAPGGETWSAGRAIAPLLRLLPGGRPLAALADRFPRAADAGYALVARHRSALGRIVRARRGR
ncbi:MAG: DCC1-like thiol-disulfide oxidoreductase [Solirubrobacteraceae bacterium]|jgi:predicted DCC family thiol-disulfide oxidoreductase YuxK|nr:DCC1-like thiol-disulfide oxidoreductase [Solirubrobacteraceae bacterium]MEA2333842.1 DCC1-like thiol-disulfide oxidoreductase [Solirubrobacteraceae bacterium]